MTTFHKVKNNAVGYLASAVDSDGTSLILESGDGALFPSEFPFWVTLGNEILECTNRATDTLTVIRAQQGTTAASHDAGAEVKLNWTAGNVDEIHDAVNNIEENMPSATFVCIVRNGSDVAYASPSGSRAVDTQYQNTSGLARTVYVYGGGASATDIYLTATIGPASANQTVGMIRTAISLEKDSMSFIVPPDYYYKCAQGGGTFDITRWTETDMGLI